MGAAPALLPAGSPFPRVSVCPPRRAIWERRGALDGAASYQPLTSHPLFRDVSAAKIYPALPQSLIQLQQRSGRW